MEVPAGLRLTSAPVLTDPNKKQLPVDAVTTASGQTVYRSRALERPGLYSLNTGAKTFPVAVNVPAEEADLRLLPADAIRKALGEIEMQTYGDDVPAAAMVRDDGADLGWTLMMVLLGLVGAECFMAMKFGHYRRTVTRTAGAPG